MIKLSVLTYMAWGAGVTVLLAAAVIALSALLGMALALVRLYAWPPLRTVAAFVVVSLQAYLAVFAYLAGPAIGLAWSVLTVIAAGADGIAVISALSLAPDPAAAARALRAIVDATLAKRSA